MSLGLSFDKDEPAYQPGETIEGKVTYNSSSDFLLQGLHMKLLGLSTVQFLHDVSTTETVTRKSSETHYEMEKMIHGNGLTEETLGAGDHVFPFTITLPIPIPGSFEGAYGYVRHKCIATLLGGSSGNDISCTRSFSVNIVYDLNEDPEAKSPSKGKNWKKKYVCCFGCDIVSFRIRLDHRGFVCGEPMFIDAKIYSPSFSDEITVLAEIEQKIHFICESFAKTQTRSVCQIRQGPLRVGGELIWNQKRLEIPTLPPSMIPHCDSIDIQYFLKFTVTSTAMPDPLTKSIPIIIGTVPLRSVCSRHFRPRRPGPPRARPVTSPDVNAPSVNQDLPPAYSQLSVYEIPPPSYHQCVVDGETLTEDDGSKTNFAPVYATYNFPPQEE